MKQTPETIHIWEAAGIGQAPFTFKGYFQTPPRHFQSVNPLAFNDIMASLAPGWPKGSCSVCGTGIRNHFMLEDANGQKLVAGSSCIYKSGDKGLIEKSTLEKRRQDRERKFQEAEAARNAKLELERQANDGLTDYELEAKQRADAEATRLAALESIIDELEPIADRLHDGRGGFRDSITACLEFANLPTGRGLSLTIEILAKEKGRKNSKAYTAEVQRLEQFFAEIAKKIKDAQ